MNRYAVRFQRGILLVFSCVTAGGVRETQNNPEQVWDALEWADMPIAEQSLWMIPGWDEARI